MRHVYENISGVFYGQLYCLALPKRQPFKLTTAFSVVVPRAQLKESIQLKKKIMKLVGAIKGARPLNPLTVNNQTRKSQEEVALTVDCTAAEYQYGKFAARKKATGQSTARRRLIFLIENRKLLFFLQYRTLLRT